MFGLGMWEILVILGLALIFIGPKKLPELAQTIGRGFREFKSAASDLKKDFDINEPPEEEEPVNVNPVPRIEQSGERQKRIEQGNPLPEDAPKLEKDASKGEQARPSEEEAEAIEEDGVAYTDKDVPKEAMHDGRIDEAYVHKPDEPDK